MMSRDTAFYMLRQLTCYMLYGAPVLPRAMALLARIDSVQVMGVPACASGIQQLR